MLILLPPSEGKAQPASGQAVDLTELSHPELTPARQRVAEQLIHVSGQPDGWRSLGVAPGIADQVARNALLWSLPAAPASQVYTGVLYDAAGIASWPEAALERSRSHIRIMSALWGAVSPTDRICTYRLPITSQLGTIGNLAKFWRAQMTEPLNGLAQDRLVVDCRSSSYAAAFKPATASTHLGVRVERDNRGKRSVVSHNAKFMRGVLTGHLIAQAKLPQNPDELAHSAAQLIGNQLIDVELSPGTLTLVIP